MNDKIGQMSLEERSTRTINLGAVVLEVQVIRLYHIVGRDLDDSYPAAAKTLLLFRSPPSPCSA